MFSHIYPGNWSYQLGPERLINDGHIDRNKLHSMQIKAVEAWVHRKSRYIYLCFENNCVFCLHSNSDRDTCRS